MTNYYSWGPYWWRYWEDAFACDPFELGWCRFDSCWPSFDFEAVEVELALDSVPFQFHSFAKHLAFVVVALDSFAPFVDDSNCSLPLDSSWAIVDDAAVTLTSMSLAIVDWIQPHYVAFVAPMDGIVMHTRPCWWFA